MRQHGAVDRCRSFADLFPAVIRLDLIRQAVRSILVKGTGQFASECGGQRIDIAHGKVVGGGEIEFAIGSDIAGKNGQAIA